MTDNVTETLLSKLDEKGVFTIVKVENVERKIGKETITEVNIETEETFDKIKNFYTSRKRMWQNSTIRVNPLNWPKIFKEVKNIE